MDLGRYEHTAKEEDKGKFKTPTPRCLTDTAPYMHDGSLKSLEEVIAFYNRGSGANPYLDTAIQPLNLTELEQSELLAFLKSLSGIGRAHV